MFYLNTHYLTQKTVRQAFDTINHKNCYSNLLFRFSKYAVNLMKSYLSERTQCVYSNGILSETFILWRTTRKCV